MKKNYTDITIVLDRSGSMAGLEDDTIGGFNAFMEDQKNLPESLSGICKVTLIQFNEVIAYNYNAVNIAHVAPLNTVTYRPRGWTALLDAMGRALTDTGNRLADMPENKRPDKVIFVVITDGYENASVEYGRDTIMSMVKTQRQLYNWQVLFLGANQDAIQEGSSLGIARACTLTWKPMPETTRSMYASVSGSVGTYRSGVTDQCTFDPEDWDKQK